jgi:hypothetical protein
MKIIPIDGGISGIYTDRDNVKYDISCKGNGHKHIYTVSKYITDTMIEPIYQTIKYGKYLVEAYGVENSTPRALEIVIMKYLLNR